MVESMRRHHLAPATRELLRVADSATDERARTDAIEGLAAQGDSDACRVLIELFERSRSPAGGLRMARGPGAWGRTRRGLAIVGALVLSAGADPTSPGAAAAGKPIHEAVAEIVAQLTATLQGRTGCSGSGSRRAPGCPW